MENTVKNININYQLAKIALLAVVIAVLWYSARSMSVAQAQNSDSNIEYVYRMIDTSAAQENPIGSAMFIAQDIDAHPELLYIDTIISKQSPKGIIMKYLVIYKKR